MEKNVSHWAYKKPDCECIAAQIRRHMEENNIPGWEVVAERPEDKMMAFKVMKFDGTILYQNEFRHVLFLEIWYYYENALDSVERLLCEL